MCVVVEQVSIVHTLESSQAESLAQHPEIVECLQTCDERHVSVVQTLESSQSDADAQHPGIGVCTQRRETQVSVVQTL